MQQDLTETILSHNTFEIYGKTILESIDNYKHISNMDLNFLAIPVSLLFMIIVIKV